MEKSAHPVPELQLDVKMTPKRLLSQKEFTSFPQGVPTQLAPLVVESYDGPDASPTGDTVSQ
jgi:hypothetical protein